MSLNVPTEIRHYVISFRGSSYSLVSEYFITINVHDHQLEARKTETDIHYYTYKLKCFGIKISYLVRYKGLHRTRTRKIKKVKIVTYKELKQLDTFYDLKTIMQKPYSTFYEHKERTHLKQVIKNQ